MTGTRGRLAFRQRAILTAGLAAALAVAGGYIGSLTRVPKGLGQPIPFPSAVSVGFLYDYDEGGLPGWARLLVWLGLAGLWGAAALFLLRGPRPDRGPVSGGRVAAVIGLAAALGVGVSAIPALTGQEAIWLAISAAQAGLIQLRPGLPGWAVLLILLAVIAAWTAVAMALLGGRRSEPAADPASS